jgi:hypothetical protein
MVKLLDVVEMNNKTKITYNKKTGRARLDIPVHELQNLLTSVRIYQYDQLNKSGHIGCDLSNEKDDDGDLTREAKHINYHLGLLEFADGIAKQLSDLVRPKEKDPLKQKRTVEERRKAVIEEIKERKLIDEIVEEGIRMKAEMVSNNDERLKDRA